jgi:hypothetical protein
MWWLCGIGMQPQAIETLPFWSITEYIPMRRFIA